MRVDGADRQSRGLAVPEYPLQATLSLIGHSHTKIGDENR